MDRIKRDIENIAIITATPQKGSTRFSYSDEDRRAREYLFKEMEKLNLEIKVDGAGNIRAKYAHGNESLPSVILGSHIDTVANGGKFDGVTGVISALELIRVIKEKKVQLKRPLELIVFAEEEGSNFGITMLGSKILTGKFSLKDLKNIKTYDGITGYDVMSNFGLDVDSIGRDVLKRNDVAAMIELHVEQGGILDLEDTPIGIVKSIAGMRTYKISLKGVSNHAGTTPMYLRKDPMAGASEIISYLEEAAKEHALPTTVGTVGKILCKPNMPNVISGEVNFYVDIRDVDPQGIEKVADALLNKTNEVAKKRGLTSSVELIGESDSVKLSSKIIEAIESSAIEENYKYKIMNSGAVHDSAMLTNFTDVGMIFVPSIGGLSHCPEERTNYEDIKLGCDLLIHAVIKLANE
ncbi:MAG: Zn-dependent hydrolase [Firmicutes bacterium]|nr:Zn-dependent hydrolase [Bacillota bacterium]